MVLTLALLLVTVTVCFVVLLVWCLCRLKDDKIKLPKDGQGKSKTIEGWELKIVTEGGRGLHTYSNPEMKPLWKIYKWYLTKDSEKYNIDYQSGMRIIHRHDIVSMELNKKQIKDIWSKDDETKTD